MAATETPQLGGSFGLNPHNVTKQQCWNDVSTDEFIPLGVVCLSPDATEDAVSPWSTDSAIDMATPETSPTPVQKALGGLAGVDRVRWLPHKLDNDPRSYARLYVLPDDVRSGTVRRLSDESTAIKRHMDTLLGSLDVSFESWQGASGDKIQFLTRSTSENVSLFYLFNTLPSPNPNPEAIPDWYSRTAAEELLDGSVPGLKSTLYHYQARSAAQMIQRETCLTVQLDPRLEGRRTPTGQDYFYGPRDMTFFKHPQQYDSCRGGILAETMGLGKTIICLAVVLATRHHLPQIPPLYEIPRQMRPKVGTLAEMSIASVNRHSIPARTYLSRLEEETGVEYEHCRKMIDSTPPTYSIPQIPYRLNRHTVIPPPKIKRLCSGTIIVVPSNLMHQWQSQISEHIYESWLEVLVVEDRLHKLPPANELAKYDIILISRQRFEREISDGSDTTGRRFHQGTVARSCRCEYIGATRSRNCTCLKANELYESPLKDLHFLRLIVDEGHQFSSRTSNAVKVASELVMAERRWVVSGTPARDRLYGVDVDLAIDDEHDEDTESSVLDGSPCSSPLPTPDRSGTPSVRREHALAKRKAFNSQEERNGAAISLGILVSYFLQTQPWYHTPGTPKVDWVDHVFVHDKRTKKTYSGFASCMRRTLEPLVVKTRLEDVESDIQLPPLKHKAVYLEPSFYDKLTANLFTFVLTSNAVTSERTDQDYLFHKNSAKPRHALISNLRQSNFFWTGFTEENVRDALSHSQRYLEKETAQCSEEDRSLLEECMRFANMVLQHPGWRALSRSHEMGMFLEHWPQDSSAQWDLRGENTSPILTGTQQLISAQSYINTKLERLDPTVGFAAEGAATLASLYAEISKENEKGDTGAESTLTMKGVPESSVGADPPSAIKIRSPRKIASPRIRRPIADNTGTPNEFASRKRSNSAAEEPTLGRDSPLAHVRVVGTASSKLSYLLEQILLHSPHEKLLIFYDGDNAAFYLAQSLEVFHVRHLIYAKTLRNALRSQYIAAFDTDPSIRVLLMDVRCGALGLNVNKASRVYFINPCHRPSVEAQAVKRAHRIGQTREVRVETLVLRGTIEERMFERAKRMTRREHDTVRRIEEDDGVRAIIQHARCLPVSAEEGVGARQMARVTMDEQIFGRKGWMSARVKLEGEDAGERKVAKRRKQDAVVADKPTEVIDLVG